MARKRRTYTREFKLEAIQLAETSDKTIADVCCGFCTTRSQNDGRFQQDTQRMISETYQK